MAYSDVCFDVKKRWDEIDMQHMVDYVTNGD